MRIDFCRFLELNNIRRKTVANAPHKATLEEVLRVALASEEHAAELVELLNYEVDPHALRKDGTVLPTGDFDWDSNSISNINDLQLAGTLTVGSETVTNSEIADWNTAFGWGDHAAAGYLTGEADPYALRKDGTVLPTGNFDWDSKDITNINDLEVTGTLTIGAEAVTDSEVGDWNAAFGWGDHGGAGYLTAEADPVFLAHDAASVTAALMADWNAAFGWGDHASGGYAADADVLKKDGSVQLSAGWDVGAQDITNVGDMDLANSKVYKVDGTQVVGAQGAAVADAAVVTTVGTNTGTSGAGLSLIGPTDTADQSAALMNDLVALQEDISDIRDQLNTALAELRTHGLIT
jgi:hypothetical protein